MPITTIHHLSGRVIRCILFDLGETLWTRADAATWLACEQAVDEHVAAILQQHLPEFISSMDDAVAKQLRATVHSSVRHHYNDDPDHEPDHILIVTQALSTLGFTDIDSSVCSLLVEALNIRIPQSRYLFDDVFPTLEALRERGFLLGVVTNRWHGGKQFREDLQALGLLEYFDYHSMAISADLGVRKPNPAIFLHALHALGIPPEEAAMVGDQLHTDILGARNLNIFAIWRPKKRLLAEAQESLLVERTFRGKVLENNRETPLHCNAEFLAFAKKHEVMRNPRFNVDVQPDLAIGCLADLLNIFYKAGKQ